MILVAGSTGSLGSEIVRQLREGGEEVRGLVRATSAPEKVKRLKQMGVETAIGDLKDRASLDNACRGVKTVISGVTIIATAQAGDSFSDTDSAGTIDLIDAAKAAGAEHFVFISFDYDRFPETPLTNAKRNVERHLELGGINYTIIKPSLFMDTWLGPHLFGDVKSGPVKVYGDGNGTVPYIFAADVARVAVHAATTPSARNQTFRITGPEAVSQRGVVKIFEEEVGKSLAITEVPEQALEAQWNTTDNPFEKTFSGLMLGVARLDEPAKKVDGLPAPRTTIREFAEQRANS
ncbi:MAG: NmrA family NAD(P)-binding protein [Gemmatimonadales bacterium]